MNHLSQKEVYLSWVFQIIAAIILGMTAFAKLTGNEMSIYVFEQLQIGGTRMIIGVIEALAALLLISKIPQYGAILSFGTMIGALIAHLSVLGLEIHDDKGEMVILMTVVIISNVLVMWVNRRKLPFIGHTCSTN